MKKGKVVQLDGIEVEVCTLKDGTEIIAFEVSPRGFANETTTYFFENDGNGWVEAVKSWEHTKNRMDSDPNYFVGWISRKYIAQKIYKESCQGVCQACLPTLVDGQIDFIYV